jgi:hypothetical protein
MAKSIVGKIENKKFAFFWLLIGGSIGNIILLLYSPELWPIFLPSVALSLLIVVMIANRKSRPKIWLGADLLAAFVPLMFSLSFTLKLAIFLPSALIIFGCFLGIMNW